MHSQSDPSMGNCLNFFGRITLHNDTRTYPVLTLPPEIVSEIFVNFLPSYPDCPPHFGLFSPLLLCRICQQWRKIAISTPALWRAIPIDIIPQDDSKTLSKKLELLETWLKRSGSCPLSLKLTQIMYPTPQHLVPQLLQAAMAHCQRWEHVAILMPFEQLHLIEGEMPLLKHLTFGPSNFPHGDPDTVTLFDQAPQLTRVILANFFLKSAMSLPWAQLTHITARCLYEYECTAIIRDAPRLVACTLSVCLSDDDTDVGPAVPAHAHLRDLLLLVDDFDLDARVWMVLDCLTLPALRMLQVTEPCITLDTLTAFVTRSQCTLEVLQVKNATLPEAVFREALPPFGTIVLEAE
ncbi:hypothetical protein B0H13DRAFT_1719999 [Mycena leptocephala]|nr:hypothetical protein B0H13DRAFT_1719999 [Mycena leptocephala]